MKKSKIPFKNYLILLLLCLFTIFLVFYLRSWYNTAKEYYQNNSILSNYLFEIRSDELTSYIMDNPETVIYYASAKDISIKNFEKDFKKLIEKYEIKNNVVYVDLSKMENSNFISKLNSISESKINNVVSPNLIYIKLGQINRVLYEKENDINKRDVQNFLMKCGVITK